MVSERIKGLSTHVQREYSAERFMHSILSLTIFTSRPGSRLLFFIQMPMECLNSSIIRLYPQNPSFQVVHDESVKIGKTLETKTHTPCMAVTAMPP